MVSLIKTQLILFHRSLQPILSLTTLTMDKVKEAVGKITGKSKLPTAKLGKNGPHVNRIGYGTMGLVSGLFEARRSHILCLHVLTVFFTTRVPSTASRNPMRSASRSSTRSTTRAISSGTLRTCTRTARTYLVSFFPFAGASAAISRSDLRTFEMQPWRLSTVQLLTPCLGQWFKQNPGKRENIFLATKFANAMKEDGTRYVDSCKER